MQQFEERELLLNRRLEAEKAEGRGQKLCLGLCWACCLVYAAAAIGTLAKIWGCIDKTKSEPSHTLPLVRQGQAGQSFTLQNMSIIPKEKWQVLSQQLTNAFATTTGYSFGYAGADEAPRLLYKGSRTVGAADLVPEKLRGVFWMRGNPLPQVLTVLQYARWFEEQQTLLLPNSPWTWAWFDGTTAMPASVASFLLQATYRFIEGKTLAVSYTQPNNIDTAVSLSFKPCPDKAVCIAGSDDFSYATVMSHPKGNLSQPGMVYFNGYTMEERPVEVQPGSLYFRRAEFFCGVFGFDGSGYQLTKIIDKDGNRLEPHYTQYLRFMRGRPVIIWSGLPDGVAADA